MGTKHPRIPSTAARYGGAILGVALATAATVLLWPVLNPYAFALYFLALIPIGLYGGLGPSLLAVALSLPAQNYFIIYPRMAWSFSPAALLGQAVFLLVAITIGMLTDRFRAEREQAEQGRRWFEGTLASIGDAVIATDAGGCVTFMNAVAEGLTGWSRDEAVSRPLSELFPIVNEETGDPVESPVEKVLRSGAIVGLANHTVLLTRAGERIPIDDSAAPVRDHTGKLTGVVLVFRDIRKRREVEEQERRTTEQIHAILESISDAFVALDAEWRYTYVNAAAAQSLRTSPAELLGRVLWDAFPALHGSWTEAELRRAASARVRVEFEDVYAPWNRWFRVVAYPARDGGISIYFQEITEHRETLEALRRSEERLLLALDAGQIGVWDWDIAANTVRWSDRIYEMHGLPPGSFGGRVEDFATLVHPEDREAVDAALQHTLSGGAPYALEFRTVRPDGEIRWIATRARVLRDEEDGPRLLIGASIDVTERRELMDELRRRADQLAEADRRKDEFLAMLAHELRNPLAPILNSVTILRLRGSADPLVEKQRELIERQARHLARMVDDLLDVSRVTRGVVTLRRGPVNLAELVEHALQACGPQLELRQHALTVSAPPEPLLVDGDRDRLVQVFTNLIQNAAKYTPTGGKINVELAREDGDAALRVRDNGEGMAPELLPRVFDLFTQADRSLDRSQGGLGIGLTLVKMLVEAHGGSVAASSAGLDHGSTFEVRLPALTGPGSRVQGPEFKVQGPVARGQGPESTAADVTPPDPRPWTLDLGPNRPLDARLKVLVVEDNPDAANSLKELLELWGHEVVVTPDGRTALQRVEKFAPELILLDIGLPQMDGYEVAREIRRRMGEAAPVLVALTGYGLDEDRERAREARIDHHLVKPVGPDELRQVLTATTAR